MSRALSRLAALGAIAVVLSPVALPIVTMILGIIAIHQIKRSGGRLYGLRLAAVEALLLPWILIIGVIGVLISGTLLVILKIFAPTNRDPGGTQSDVAFGGPVLIAILPALVISFFACRALWRAVVGRPVQVKPALPAPDISLQPSRVGAVSLTLAIAGTVLPILLLLVESHRRSAPDGDLLLCLSLGFLLEVAALGCGIVGRRTPAGKAGIIIAIVALLLYVLIPSFFFARYDSKMTTHSAIESSTVSTPGIRTDQPVPATTQLSQP